MKSTITLIVLLLAAIAFTALSVNADQSREDAAVKVAKNWLHIVDSGKYEKSWVLAASMFKNAVTKKQWTGSMDAYRKPLGKLVKRKLKYKQYATSLPGAPDG